MASKPKGSLLPAMSDLPTKQERYKVLRKIKASSLTDENSYCRNALRTTPIVTKTTTKFNEDLSLLAKDRLYLRLGPTQLNILKKCTETFSSIIKNSCKHREKLQEIKRGYDSYLNSVLRGFEQDVVVSAKMHKKSTTNKSKIDKECIMQEVESLEGHALELFKENKRLQEILEGERERLRVELPPMDEDSPNTRSDPMEGIIDYTDHVTYLQQQIFDLHSGAKESVKQRSGLVPLIVCQNLEECIRSSELNIQLLKKQESVLLAHIEESEAKLHKYFDAMKTPKQEIEVLFSVLRKNALEVNR